MNNCPLLKAPSASHSSKQSIINPSKIFTLATLPTDMTVRAMLYQLSGSMRRCPPLLTPFRRANSCASGDGTHVRNGSPLHYDYDEGKVSVGGWTDAEGTPLPASNRGIFRRYDRFRKGGCHGSLSRADGQRRGILSFLPSSPRLDAISLVPSLSLYSYQTSHPFGSGRLPGQQPEPNVPFPRPVDPHAQFRQPVVARANVSFYRVFREAEDFVAPRRLVEENGEGRVAFFRFLPHAAGGISGSAMYLQTRIRVMGCDSGRGGV